MCYNDDEKAALDPCWKKQASSKSTKEVVENEKQLNLISSSVERKENLISSSVEGRKENLISSSVEKLNAAVKKCNDSTEIVVKQLLANIENIAGNVTQNNEQAIEDAVVIETSKRNAEYYKIINAVSDALSDVTKSESNGHLYAMADAYFKHLQQELNTTQSNIYLKKEYFGEFVYVLIKNVKDFLLQCDDQIETYKSYFNEQGEIVEIEMKRHENLIFQKNQQEIEKAFQHIYENETVKVIENYDSDKMKFDNELEVTQHSVFAEYMKEKAYMQQSIHELQKTLNNITANQKLDSDMLEYNLKVLHDRQGRYANSLLQQKQSINRARDQLNVIINQYNTQEKNMSKQIEKESREFSFLVKHYRELLTKYHRLQSQEWRDYYKIWKMKVDEALYYTATLLTANEVIHEKILNIPYSGFSFSEIEDGDRGNTKLIEQDDNASRYSGFSTNVDDTGRASTRRGGNDGDKYDFDDDKKSIAASNRSGMTGCNIDINQTKLTKICQLIESECPFILNQNVRKKNLTEEAKQQLILEYLGATTSQFQLLLITTFYAGQESDDDTLLVAMHEIMNLLFEYLEEKNNLQVINSVTNINSRKKHGDKNSNKKKHEEKIKREVEHFWKKSAVVLSQSTLDTWHCLQTFQIKYLELLRERDSLVNKVAKQTQEEIELNNDILKMENVNRSSVLIYTAIPPAGTRKLSKESSSKLVLSTSTISPQLLSSQFISKNSINSSKLVDKNNNTIK